MLSIVILGTGNVARHLFRGFKKSGEVKVIQVAGRNRDALSYFEKHTEIASDFREIAIADIYIIALSDDAIPIVSKQLIKNNKMLLHTSGSVGLDALPKGHRRGVFYPLQSFTKELKINFKEVPICIEATNKDDLKILKKLATELTDKVYQISSDQRRSLHLAAVFANNFTNHLYAIADDICQEKGIPFSILHPLILETARKLEKLSPYQAQTGPARRGDHGTMQKHMQLLNKEQAELYAMFSKAIGGAYEVPGDI